ncbi:MAG: hypothetical protein ACE5D1_08675 [Fidelibacterota bacterium]
MRLILLTLLISAITIGYAAPVDCSTCHDGSMPLAGKTAGFSEKAVGVLDKGQLQVNTSNFGDLADFHVWFTNSGHWPKQAPDDHPA